MVSPSAPETEPSPKAEVSREQQKQTENIQENNGRMSLASISQPSQATSAAVIANYLETLKELQSRNLGYPLNQEFNYEELKPLFQLHLNNVGDPFKGSSLSLNSTEFELRVLEWFANLWEINKDEYWGYVTTGGTEGNMHGILVGRERFPDGILYTSQDSHYSVFKIARMYRMECVEVATLDSGEINCVALEALLNANKDKPAIINLNIGTTMKGAVDHVDHVIQTLEKCGFCSDRFYIHCDGALFGIMLPLVNEEQEQERVITFKKPIGSVSVSGHKFLGCPIPCGVVINRRQEHNAALSKNVEYIASRDATITGSRCGLTPIFLWYALKERRLKEEVQKCIKNAIYLRNKLCNDGFLAILNKFSCTVFFERPPDDNFTRRWNLACQGNIAHIVVMQHVTREMLDRFLSELVEKRSIWRKDGPRIQTLCIATDFGPENCDCKMHKHNLE